MVDTIIVNPKDRVLISRDKSGEYGIREVTIHGEDIYELLPKAGQIISQLRDDKIPTAPQARQYVCTSCKYTMPAFPEHPQVGRYYCPRCNKWVNFEKK